MIVKDEAYFIASRVFLVQNLQEADEIRAFVGRTYKGDCFANKQVNGCKRKIKPVFQYGHRRFGWD